MGAVPSQKSASGINFSSQSAAFRVVERYVGNLPTMLGVFPECPASVVRNTDTGTKLRWFMTMSIKTIDVDGLARIVQATKIENPTEEPDLGALSRCIERCASWYLEAIKNTSGNHQQLGSIKKAAKRLEQLLAEERLPLQDVDRHRVSVKDLIREIDGHLRWNEKGPAKAMQQNLSNRSPFEWIAGNYLADVYQLIFDRKPAYSPDGPFVRFVEATLHELEITNSGKPYSRASISKARKDDESGLTRRDRALARRDGFRRWRRRLLIQACVGHPEYEDGEPSDKT